MMCSGIHFTFTANFAATTVLDSHYSLHRCMTHQKILSREYYRAHSARGTRILYNTHFTTYREDATNKVTENLKKKGKFLQENYGLKTATSEGICQENVLCVFCSSVLNTSSILSLHCHPGTLVQQKQNIMFEQEGSFLTLGTDICE